MVFSDTAVCPQFCPNYFQADMCVDCQNKIQAHAGATDKQVRGSTTLSGTARTFASLQSPALHLVLHLVFLIDIIVQS